MDMLDPLDSSPECEVIDTKVLAKVDIMDSDDDQNVDHLSPQTLLETPESGMVTYRVLQVGDGNTDTVQHIVTTGGGNFPSNSTIPQVLTSNINGQLYVIGNHVIGSPGDVFNSQGSGRTIAPRPSPTDNGGVVHNIKKRDDRRRATHNEVERRRRDKINNWITKLSKLIPETTHDIKGNGQYDGQSKGGILSKACEYILELQQSHSNVDTLLKENKHLKQAVDALKQKNFVLERQNKEFREMLKRRGIDEPSEISS